MNEDNLTNIDSKDKSNEKMNGKSFVGRGTGNSLGRKKNRLIVTILLILLLVIVIYFFISFSKLSKYFNKAGNQKLSEDYSKNELLTPTPTSQFSATPMPGFIGTPGDLIPIKYFEGTFFYEEVGGQKKLLVQEGTINNIDVASGVISIERAGSEAEIQHQENDQIYLVNYEKNLLDQIEIEQLKAGDHVSYSRANEDSGQLQNIWIIQR